MEKWKDIKGYEGYYKISNYGNVKSIDRIVTYSSGKKVFYKSKKRKASISEYRMIVLCKNRRCKGFKISRLVAEHFLNKKNGKNIVNHIDGNKHNDNVNNLEWCTYSENTLHAFNNNLNKKKNEVSGVFFEKRRNKWASYIYRNNKNIFVGRFNTEEEAIKERENELKKYENKH